MNPFFAFVLTLGEALSHAGVRAVPVPLVRRLFGGAVVMPPSAATR